MEREPGDREVDEVGSAPAYQPTSFQKAVENREVITINAWHIDQLIGAILTCTSAIYEVAEAIEAGESKRFRDESLRSAKKSAEESYRLMEELTNNLIK